MHDGYFGDSHETIDISHYQEKSKTYLETTRCDKHPEELVKMACKECFMFLCVKCNAQGRLSCSEVWHIMNKNITVQEPTTFVNVNRDENIEKKTRQS